MTTTGLTEAQLDNFPCGDVLVLAGDIFNARCLDPRRTDSASRKQRKRVHIFLQRCIINFEHVIYVTGNHEYYGTSIQEAHSILTAYLPIKILWLYNHHVELDGVIFAGGTLWTSLDDGKRGSNWQREMNDSDEIGWSTSSCWGGKYAPRLNPDNVWSMHQTTLAAISRATKKGKPVVVTHHCPSHMCNSPEFAGLDTWPGYITNLHKFIMDRTNIKAWICGHSHHHTSFYIGGCNVRMNSLGYIGSEPMADSFEPDTWFEFSELRAAADSAEGGTDPLSGAALDAGACASSVFPPKDCAGAGMFSGIRLTKPYPLQYKHPALRETPFCNIYNGNIHAKAQEESTEQGTVLKTEILTSADVAKRIVQRERGTIEKALQPQEG